MGVLLATGLIVGDSLSSVAFAGIVAATGNAGGARSGRRGLRDRRADRRARSSSSPMVAWLYRHTARRRPASAWPRLASSQR